MARALMRLAFRPSGKRKARGKRPPQGFWATLDEAAAAQAKAAPLPPGATEDWLAFVRQDRGSRAWRQNFRPFDIAFDYEDADGQPSARRLTVAVVRVETYGGTVRPGVVMAYGWCHTAREPRSFRADRIRNLRDALTGEVAADARQWLLDRSGRKHG